jgi:hypothetical protein
MIKNYFVSSQYWGYGWGRKRAAGFFPMASGPMAGGPASSYGYMAR